MKYLWALIVMLIAAAMVGRFNLGSLWALILVIGLPALIIWKGPKP